MNDNVKKAMVRSLVWNFVIAVIAFIPFLFLPDRNTLEWAFIVLIIAAFSLVIQIVAGIIYITQPDQRETGQGMLISVGIILVLGLCTCGMLLS
jgi:uncharacterized membrane protein YozB (DUF420 family)